MTQGVDGVEGVAQVEEGGEEAQDQQGADGEQRRPGHTVGRGCGLLADGPVGLDEAQGEESAHGHLCQDREQDHGELGGVHQISLGFAMDPVPSSHDWASR